MTSQSSKILAADAATETLLKRSSRLLVGKPLAVMMNVEDRPDFRSGLASLREHGRRRNWRVRLRAPDGTAIPVLARVEVIEGAIPEGSDSEQTLRWSILAESEAPIYATENAEDALERLVAELVHELNQPLAAIVSYARGSVLRHQAGELTVAALETAMEQIVVEALRASTFLRGTVERWDKGR